MNVPFAPGTQPQNSGAHEVPPASHVGHPHPSHPVRLHLTRTVGEGTVTIAGMVKDVHVSSEVLPERVRPKGEPREESKPRPTGKGRRKGPRRRGR